MSTTVYKILAVDDDQFTQQIVKVALERAGFHVTTAETAEQALRHFKRHGLPHLALVDLNLPGKFDGLEFCRRTKKFSDLPIVILSANKQTKVIVQAIDLYAEDYVIKPFNPRELVARVRRVLHRIGNFAYKLDQTTHVDEYLSVDFSNRCLTRDDQTVSLTPTETKLLYILMRHARTTVSISFLLERLWPLEPANEDRLRVLIYRLRRKLEPQPKHPRYILSDHGIGYQFSMPKTTEPSLN